MEFVDKRFIYWAAEREAVRQRRTAGYPREQWSVDPIFHENRFCNVAREDDRTTIWIKQNIRDPFDQAGDEFAMFQAIALSRFFNLPESLGKLIEEGVLTPNKKLDLHDVHEVISTHAASAKETRAFSPAYMVGAPDNHRTYEFGFDKPAYVCGVLNAVVMPTARTRQGFVEELCKQFGFAEFMSGQIAADLAYTSVLRDAPDHMTWAPRGPGAMRGMNRAIGQPIERKIPRDEYLAVGIAQMALLPPEIVEGRNLTLHDVASNVNCESFKYMRAADGTRGRRKFSPKS
jgi:hypothetical protein